MKITVTKVIRKLEKKHDWVGVYINQDYQKELIKDVLIIVDEQLRAHKNITILGK